MPLNICLETKSYKKEKKAKELVKKSQILSITFICFIVVVFSSCRRSDTYNAFKKSFDKKGNYTGFSDLPEKYTFENAKKDGCLVLQDLVILENENLWEEFVNTTSKKEDSSIRIATFYTDTNNSYLQDLYYVNGHYYSFSSTLGGKKKKGFLYLLTLREIDDNSPLRITYVLLTNDKDLTYYRVSKDIESAVTDDSRAGKRTDKNIPKYEIVFIKYKPKSKIRYRLHD